MLYQVMYRLPGSEWREYGLPLDGVSVGAARYQCEHQYPTATVVTVEGYGHEALRENVARQAQQQPDLDARREAMEQGPGGDHDTTERYIPSERDLYAWSKVIARVAKGELSEGV